MGNTQSNPKRASQSYIWSLNRSLATFLAKTPTSTIKLPYPEAILLGLPIKRLLTSLNGISQDNVSGITLSETLSMRTITAIIHSQVAKKSSKLLRF
jgi:hypothetical protein